MIQSLGTEHPGHVLGLCHKLPQTLLTSTRQSRAQPPTPGADVGECPLPQPIPQVRGVGSVTVGDTTAPSRDCLPKHSPQEP